MTAAEISTRSGGEGEGAADGRFNWYAVQTYSGFENKVKLAIEHRTTLEGLKDKLNRVVIPTEMVVEIKSGKKRQVQRSLMPGYVLVEMERSEDLFTLIKEIKGVASFVGGGDVPAALTQDEVKNLLNLMDDKHEKPKPKVTYRRGDQVKVVEGPFTNFTGNVEGVDEDKGRLTVMVSIFGRPTPVELEVLQVEAV